MAAPEKQSHFTSIAGGIIMLLLTVIGYFLSGVYTELREMRTVLVNILVSNGELNKEVEALKLDQSKLWTRMAEHDAQILRFYQDQFDNKSKK
jgi:hypothetical protein